MKTAAYLASALALSLFAAASASALTITENTNPTLVTAQNSVSCNAGGVNNDNTYFRAFSFSSFGISSGFAISQVQFGIEQASNSTGFTPLTLSIYSGTNLNSLGTALASVSLSVANQNLTLFNATIAALVPQSAGGFIVSVFSPQDSANSSKFFIGSNAAGQSAPSYLLAPACGVTTPTDLASLGFPSMDIVMSVTGTPLAVVSVPDSGTTVVLLGLGFVGLALVQRSIRQRANA